jgi:hypothetical protein
MKSRVDRPLSPSERKLMFWFLNRDNAPAHPSTVGAEVFPPDPVTGCTRRSAQGDAFAANRHLAHLSQRGILVRRWPDSGAWELTETGIQRAKVLREARNEEFRDYYERSCPK